MILDRYFNDKNIADVDDIQLEIWLRKRNKGEIVWITKDKKQIPIKDLSDDYLQNIYNIMLKEEDFDMQNIDIYNIVKIMMTFTDFQKLIKK